jgi:hypothetical protein
MIRCVTGNDLMFDFAVRLAQTYHVTGVLATGRFRKRFRTDYIMLRARNREREGFAGSGASAGNADHARSPFVSQAAGPDSRRILIKR